MSENFEFNLKETTFQKMIDVKKQMGYRDKNWDEWFDYLISKQNLIIKSELEAALEKSHYKNNFENWVRSFALNLEDIWNGKSARELDPAVGQDYVPEQSALVIGGGPSLKKHNHLEMLAQSDYQGSILCVDRGLIHALNAGVTPDKFPNFFVVTIDGYEIVKELYDHKIINKFGPQINGIFSTVSHPLAIKQAKKAGIEIHWLHALFDYQEGRKSFNKISGLMVRAKNHEKGLPAIQTGGNVGTSSWFIAWRILKCPVVGFIGINHGWNSWDEIFYHAIPKEKLDTNDPTFRKTCIEIYNPGFNCNCILDPIYRYYSEAFNEFISRSPSWLTSINCTGGGSIFGERVKCTNFENFLKWYRK